MCIRDSIIYLVAYRCGIPLYRNGSFGWCRHRPVNDTGKRSRRRKTVPHLECFLAPVIRLELSARRYFHWVYVVPRNAEFHDPVVDCIFNCIGGPRPCFWQPWALGRPCSVNGGANHNDGLDAAKTSKDDWHLRSRPNLSVAQYLASG